MNEYSTSLLFIQSIIVSLCLPRVLVPSILPSKTVHRRDHFSAHDLTNFLSLSDGVHQASVLIHHVQNLLIGSVFSPTDFHQPSPAPHFKRFQPLNVHFPQRPCFCGIQYRTPNQSIYYSLFFNFNFNFIFPLNNSLRLLNASFPMAIRRFRGTNNHVISIFQRWGLPSNFQ